MSKSQQSDTQSVFAHKLDELFNRIRKPDGNTFSYGDVAKGIQDQKAGVSSITPGYIWKLRTGMIKNPGYQVIKAIANFFDVPVSYFFDENEGKEEKLDEIDLARQLRRSPQAQQIALRASDLAENEQEAVLAKIGAIQQAKGGKKQP
jgi:transcriptional regulator with XRE-family HTH domain